MWEGGEVRNRIDLVIFDCDGVLVDSELLACGALADLLAVHGAPIGLEEVLARFLGRSFGAVEAFYRVRCGRELPAGFRPDLHARVEAAYCAGLRPMAGIAAVLARIDRPFCLASSSDLGRIRFTLAAANLADPFGERVYSANHVRFGKPAPDLFLYAAEKMARDPRRCLVVEDTVAGVLAGKAAGMTVWGFTGGSHCVGRDVARKLSAAGADRVFDRMSEFFAGWDSRNDGRAENREVTS